MWPVVVTVCLTSWLLLTTTHVTSGGVIIRVDGQPTVQSPLYVQQGDTLQLVCSSTENDDVTMTWAHNDTLIDAGGGGVGVASGRGSSSHRRLRVRNAAASSRLTLTNASHLDSGMYSCLTRYHSDRLDVIVQDIQHRQQDVTPGVQVFIIDPLEDALRVRHGQSFTLKCISGRQQSAVHPRPSLLPGPSPATLQWFHNGRPLRSGTSSGLCGRLVFTEAVDVDTGWMTSLLSCSNATSREVGVFECRDVGGLAADHVTVSVELRQNSHQVAVEIFYPASKQQRVKVGSNIQLKCKGDVSTTLSWFVNETGSPLRSVSAGGIYITSTVDQMALVSTSMLELIAVTVQQSGRYVCRSRRDDTDSDYITVVVDSEDSESVDKLEVDTPTLPSLVLMRIRSTVSLQCSFQSSMDLLTHWTKDGWSLTTDNKYHITQEQLTNTLTVLNTDVSDVGEYRCSLWYKDRRKLAGILIFNVTTISCPLLTTPVNGQLVLCPQPAVYGSVCTFQCNPGYQLTDRTPRVCELHDNKSSTYWSPPGPGGPGAGVDVTPRCIASASSQLPTTVSSVRLRVGAKLQLRCTGMVLSWTKDDKFLQDGFKYTIEGQTLTVRQTVGSDAGVYMCSIHRNLTVIGQNKFNVTTLSCPGLAAPPGASVEHCPDSPVYGETCSFQCTNNRATIVSGNRIRSCEVTNFDTVYWSGQPPICSDSHHSSGHHSSSSSRSISPSYIPVLLTIFIALCRYSIER